MNNPIVIQNKTLTSDQIADMGAKLFHTFAVVSSLTDVKGRCELSQETLALYMGVTRETANRRIKRLLAYRWQGEAVLIVGQISGGLVYHVNKRNPPPAKWVTAENSVL